MPCLACKRDISIVAKGLCGACYKRKQKTGSTDYQRKGRFSLCQVNGCGARAVARGYCDKHRKRLDRHDSLELKFDSWGAKWKHPLRHTWHHLRRRKGRETVCPEWIDDFLRFIHDVGERPSPKHQLYSADDSRPLGPGNFVWKRSPVERVAGEDERTFNNRRARVYRGLDPEGYKKYDLKKLYGLSRDEYAAMVKRQQGQCAICGKSEANVIRQKTVALAVDHCHNTGRVRELLCSACNTLIGLANDDPDLLQRAIAYLERHKAPEAS